MSVNYLDVDVVGIKERFRATVTTTVLPDV